ncbi:MAG: hypothetical protein ACPG46_01645 [Thalassotalea sp.]
MSKQSLSQVSQSKLIKDKVAAYTDVYSTKSFIIFELLTKSPRQLERESGWDFSGKEFILADTRVKIQDLNGLLNIYNFFSHKVFSSVLNQCGIEIGKSSIIAKKVMEQHLGTKEYAVDKYQRLFSLAGDIGDETKDCINQNITRFAGAIFNPATAPKEYLTAKLGNNAANRVIQAKANSREELARVVNELTPDDPELNQRNIIGPYFRVTLTSTKQESTWSEMIEVKFTQKIIKQPLTFLGYSPL